MSEYDLKLAIAQSQRKRMNFRVYRGEDANQILITAQPASNKQVSDLEKKCGEVKLILKGICFWENDQMVFTTKTMPAPAWEMMITKVFKEEKCSKYLPIILRQMGAHESDELTGDETTPAATGPVAPPSGSEGSGDPHAQWLQLKAELSPRISAAVQANPPNKAQILQLLKAGLDHEKSGSFADAITAFQQLAGLIQNAPPPPSGVVPPPPPPPVQAPQGPDLIAALNKLVPTIKETIAAQPGRKDEIMRLVAAVQGAIKASQFAEAVPALAALEAALKPAGSQTGSESPEPQPQTTPPPDGAVVLETWRNAKESVDVHINALRAALLKEEDPQPRRIANEGITDGGLNALTDGFMTGLWAALFDYSQAPTEAKKANVLKATAGLRQHLAGNNRLTLCENNPLTGPLKIREPLLNALAEVDRLLAA